MMDRRWPFTTGSPLAFPLSLIPYRTQRSRSFNSTREGRTYMKMKRECVCVVCFEKVTMARWWEFVPAVVS